MRSQFWKRVCSALVAGPKMLVRVIVVGIGLIILFFIGSAVYVATQSVGVPEEAGWSVLTYSHIDGKALPMRVYYGERYLQVDGSPALEGYWTFDGKRYVYHRGVKSFPKEEWGSVTVTRRAKQ